VPTEVLEGDGTDIDDPILGGLETEEPSGDEDSAVLDTGSETVETEAEGEPGIPADWRDIAQSYGLNDASIDKFDTVEALESHLRSIDQMRQGTQQTWQQEQAAPATETPASSAAFEAIKQKLNDLPDDDPARIGLEYMASEIAELKKNQHQFQQAQEQQRAVEFQRKISSEFDEALNDVKHAAFGQADKMIGKQWENRNSLYCDLFLPAVHAQLQRGQQPDFKKLAKDCANARFPQQFQQQQQQTVTNAYRERSSKRTGAGSRGPNKDRPIPLTEDPSFDALIARAARGE
jgi:hypothetical protein